ncbi:MAG: class I SAM-dependent methyltransferase [Verrucomicrobiota bacterium]|nr:class I SAM-dependent methyltransferase [Verrucomicrobiota bacterium]
MAAFPTIRTYPEALESFWQDEARAVTRCSDLGGALEKLEPAVQMLSDLFTVARPEKFRDYGADALQRTAYGLFYFPQSFVRVGFPLAELLDVRGWRPDTSGIRILDLGAGLGACGLGAARVIRSRGFTQPITLDALDHSPAKLAVLGKVAMTACADYQPLTLRTHPGDLRKAENLLDRHGPYDLILCGFALNEACAGKPVEQSAALVNTWLRALKPGGVLLILEPALQPTARALAALGDFILASKRCVRLAPYAGTHPDPLTADRFHWSHEVRRWTIPESLRFLNRHLWRDLDVLKFSFLALTANPDAFTPLPKPTNEHFRLISPFSLMKGRFLATGVGTDGLVYTYDLPTRGMEKPEIQAHEAIERGDLLTVNDLVALGSERTYRIPKASAILNRHGIE